MSHSRVRCLAACTPQLQLLACLSSSWPISRTCTYAVPALSYIYTRVRVYVCVGEYVCMCVCSSIWLVTVCSSIWLVTAIFDVTLSKGPPAHTDIRQLKHSIRTPRHPHTLIHTDGQVG